MCRILLRIIFYLIKVKEGGNDLMGIRMQKGSIVLFLEIFRGFILYYLTNLKGCWVNEDEGSRGKTWG